MPDLPALLVRRLRREDILIGRGLPRSVVAPPLIQSLVNALEFRVLYVARFKRPKQCVKRYSNKEVLLVRPHAHVHRCRATPVANVPQLTGQYIRHETPLGPLGRFESVVAKPSVKRRDGTPELGTRLENMHEPPVMPGVLVPQGLLHCRETSRNKGRNKQEHTDAKLHSPSSRFRLCCRGHAKFNELSGAWPTSGWKQQ